MPEASRVDRYERRAAIPLLVASLAFLVAYAWPVLDPDIDRSVASWLNAVSWTVWALFAADFAARLSLVGDRRRYLVSHWYDVALLVLPMLRPLRLLRVVSTARILHRAAVRDLAGRVTLFIVASTVMAVGLAALAELQAEREAPGANITTFGDSLWWAVTTVTTVGYGDRYPVTTQGRLVATVLMVVGVALISALTAVIATWLVSSVIPAESPDEPGGATDRPLA